MGWACSICGEDENAYFYNNLFQKSPKEVEHLHGKGCEGVDWICVAQERVQC